MKTIVIYEAKDGRQFSDEQKCVAYECTIEQNRKKINESITTLKEHCHNTICGNCFAFNHFNGRCAFCEDDPKDWVMEM